MTSPVEWRIESGVGSDIRGKINATWSSVIAFVNAKMIGVIGGFL